MAGLAPDRVARIAPWLEARVAAGLPGAVALVARGDDVQVVAAGMRDVAAATPMRRDSIFRIASMTKPIIAAAALTLIEEAAIALDDSVERWLPELADRRVLRSIESGLDDTVPAGRPITVRDLLTFRFGLGAVMAAPGTYPIQRSMADLDVAPGPHQLSVTPDAFITRIASLPLIHQPGERWMYHTGIDVLAVLLARATAQPLDALLRERLFVPLGMADTGFVVEATRLDRLGTAYRTQGAALSVWDAAAGGMYTAPPSFPNALVSTVDDYLAFCRMLLAGGVGPHGRILSRASVTLMMSDQLTPAQKADPSASLLLDGNGWGFGGAVTTTRTDIDTNPGAYGWSGGLGTHFTIDPAEGLIAMLLTQKMMTGPDDTAIGRQLFTLAYSALDD